MSVKKFTNNNLLDASSVNYNGTSLPTTLATIPKLSWKTVNWSGDKTGGTITTNVNLKDKLVTLVFVCKNNTAHNTYCTFYWMYNNNYLLVQMYNTTYYITANSTTATGFNLIISDPILQLKSIVYLDIA